VGTVTFDFMESTPRTEALHRQPTTGLRKLIAIIGDPIEHSITPRIQNAAWQSLRDAGQDAGEQLADVVNVAFRVAPENLESAVRGALALGFLGLMVTIPHKERVLALCDELHSSARFMGAANLLHFQDGKIIGHSSDGWAAVRSLEEEGVSIPGKRIAILGGGGAARSLALTFAREGAAEILIFNRTVARAGKIADEVLDLGVAARALRLEASTLYSDLAHCDVLVNATSVGMHPREGESLLSDDVLREVLTPQTAVYDIVYNPLETRLIKVAHGCGARVVDGLGMLIYTNVYAAQICAATTLSAAVMRAEALRALGHDSA
jgi:shikimate dehydrogenase